VFDLQSGDRWEGYQAQREEILRYIDELPISGVLWVAGDFHLGSMGRVARTGLGAEQVEVLVGPGAQNGNVLAATLGPPQFYWASSENNYTELAFDPASRTVDVRFHNGEGFVIASHTYEL